MDNAHRRSNTLRDSGNGMGLQADGSLENPGRRVPKVKAEGMRISQAKGQWKMQRAGILPAFVLCHGSFALPWLFYDIGKFSFSYIIKSPLGK